LGDGRQYFAFGVASCFRICNLGVFVLTFRTCLANLVFRSRTHRTSFEGVVPTRVNLLRLKHVSFDPRTQPFHSCDVRHSTNRVNAHPQEEPRQQHFASQLSSHPPTSTTLPTRLINLTSHIMAFNETSSAHDSSQQFQQWRCEDLNDPCEYTTEAAKLIPVPDLDGNGDVPALLFSWRLANAITNALSKGRDYKDMVSQSNEAREKIEARRTDAMGRLKCAKLLLKQYRRKLKNPG
jgi:hypothetical protein